MRLLLFMTVLTMFATEVGAAALGSEVQSRQNKDGAIISTADGFPYETYEQWFEEGRKQIVFDEASLRSEYPPEKFNDYKDKIHVPFATYDEWMSHLKRRSAMMLEKWKSIEAETRRSCPPEMFWEFKKTVDCSKIFYISDGLKIEGFVLKPRISNSGRYPVIIYNHGGNSRLASLDDTKLLHLGWLVRAGYLVIASQYRGCGGSEGQDEIGGSDVADVLNLIPLIDSLPFADATKIGMFGWSRGGMMAYLTLAKTDRISVAVIGAGPTDFFTEVKNRSVVELLLQRMVPGYTENRDDVLKDRSAQYWPEKLCRTTPILILQGGEDKRCVPASALKMALKLQECHQPFRLIFFEAGSHTLHEHQEEVDHEIRLWFAGHLK